MGFQDRLKSRALEAIRGGAVRKFFGFWTGRCTFFAIAFSIVGCYGWLILGRDMTSFALFAGAIQALLVAHSAKEDYSAQKQAQAQSTQVVTNITVDPNTHTPPSSTPPLT